MSISASEMILPATKKNVKLSVSENQDRLSDLPDCVILHILSFLNAKHAVQTCVLSIRYENLWKRIPVLILDSSESNFRTLKIFTEFVSNVLSHRDSSISLQTLNFKRKHGRLEPQIIKNIVDYALSHNVQQLGLCFNGNTVQTLPSMFSSQSLTHLNLSIYPSGGNVSSLKHVDIHAEVLSLIPNLSQISPPSLGNLKSLKVKMEELTPGFRMTLLDAKLYNAESKNERKRLRKKFKEEGSGSLIPDGIVNFLLQNSPSAEFPEVALVLLYYQLINASLLDKQIDIVRVLAGCSFRSNILNDWGSNILIRKCKELLMFQPNINEVSTRQNNTTHSRTINCLSDERFALWLSPNCLSDVDVCGLLYAIQLAPDLCGPRSAVVDITHGFT
ncbi:F-box family protein [Trifolium pratense]|uniref:F-box family protein n=2 Tax=Trifolium pratense TaxID=57577 RepID=A0A2K3KXT8_TRIPR|nr:F-box family protein [Trifolium pratense]